jgi:hypothetical protein
MLCERALALIRGKRLDLADADKGRLEALDYEGLIGAGAQEEAVSCARHFEGVRDRLLCSYPWVFARKTAAPAQLSSPLPLGWRVAFRLPSDCLKTLAVVARGRRTLFRRYEVLGRTLLADAAPVQLIYTARIADTRLWDDSFADAFCSLLAGEMGAAVMGEPQLISMMEQRAAGILQTARAAGLLAEVALPPFELPEYLDYSGVRGGGGSESYS